MTSWILRFILLTVASVLCHEISGQEHPWMNYTTEDGLPTNYVYGVVEADDGLIWVYTEDGIAKFDGNEFKTYTIADGLPDNDVYFIEKDKKGTCWISTFGSFLSYIDADSIKRVVSGETRLSGRVAIINGMPYSFELNMYLPIDKDMILGKTNSFLPKKKWLPPRKVFENLQITLDFEKKQVIFNDDQEGPKAFPSEILGDQFSYNEDIINDPRSDLYIGAFYHGFFIYDAALNDFREYKWTDLGIKLNRKSFTHIHHPYVFLNHGSGFIKIDSTGAIADQFIATDLIKNHEMRNFISDSQGNIWAGSREGGLFFLSHHNRNNKKIWSSGNGLNIIEKIIPINDQNIVFLADQDHPIYLQEGEILSNNRFEKMGLFTDAVLLPNNNILCTYAEKIIEWDEKFRPINFENKFKNIENKCRFTRKGSIGKIFNNLKNLAWDYTSNALLSNSHQLMVFTVKSQNELTVTDHDIKVKDLEAATDGGVWVGSPGTIYKFAHHNIDSIFSHPDLQYLTKIYDAGGFLFIATEDKGIFRLDVKTKTLSSIFQTTNINNIGPGLKESILVSTNQGIFRLSKNNGDLIDHYKKSAGLSANQVLDVYENQKGLWVASSKGIDNIVSSSPPEKEHEFSLSIASILVNNEEFDEFDKGLNLSSGQNTIKFSFNLLDYTSSGDITYFTKLSPLQDEWTTSKTPEVVYFGLAPNAYTFELKAKRFNGQEIIYPGKININVGPPFYKNPWIYFGLSLLALIGFYIFIRRERIQKERQFENEKRINKKISETQLSALRSQMNPHFIFNALGAIQYFVQTKNTDLADDYLSEFALLMRKYLEASKQPTILLKDEIELLQLYTKIEAMRFDHLFKTTIDVAPELDIHDIRIPSVLIQPFVENAILHGLQPRSDTGGLLNISFYQIKDALLVKITDNGIGMAKALTQKNPLHKSRGLENIIDRMTTLEIATGLKIGFQQSTPFPQSTSYAGHEVLITFEQLLA